MGIRERSCRRSMSLLLGSVAFIVAATVTGCSRLNFESIAHAPQPGARGHAVASLGALPVFNTMELTLPRDVTPDQAVRMELSEVYGPDPFALDNPPWFSVETVAYTPEEPEPPVGEPAQLDGSVRATPRSARLGEVPVSVSGNVPSGSPLPEGITRVISRYGMRGNPESGFLRRHNGIDLKAPHGTPIRVTADGVVSLSGRQRGYGNIVIVDHGNGYETVYAHLAARRVQEGARLRRGDVLGTLGSTGRVTTHHLHYEVRRNGDFVNPSGYLPALRVQ